jgi:hypothetical protein
LGDNSVQTVRIEQDVRWLKVNLRGSGTVPSIRFCR